MAGDKTPKKHAGMAPNWEPGKSGNPTGRPKGSRNKLGEDFIRALSDHWAENGAEARDACAKKTPAAYVKTVAALLPKEIILKEGNKFTDAVNELTDDELADAIRALRSIVGTGGRKRQPDGEGEPSSVH